MGAQEEAESRLHELCATYNADQRSGIKIVREQTAEGTRFVYLRVRTTSWEFAGERTDLHDALSVLAACFLRTFSPKVSCRFWDVPHPADGIPDTEVYERLLTLEQPNASTYELDNDGVEQLERLVSTLLLFNALLPRIFGWTELSSGEREYNVDQAESWAQRVSSVIGETFPRDTRYNVDQAASDIRVSTAADEASPYDKEYYGDFVQYNLRRNPDWTYYRSIRSGFSVYHSPELATALRALVRNPSPWDTIAGIDGDLYLSSAAKNVIPYEDARRARGVIRRLNDTLRDVEPVYIPLENRFVAAGGDVALFVERECGRKRFEEERERVRQRHTKEAELLFPATDVQFVWNDKVDGARFESLILDLLQREPGVRWARRVSASNEPDGGETSSPSGTRRPCRDRFSMKTSHP